MRDVFFTQPTRRFIYGFTILGTTMELWVFDRSGPYSSGPLDIHEKPKQFIQAIAGYAMMTDEELGLDTFIKRDGEDLFITITEDATGEKKRLQLQREPLVVQRAIVCRGTNCYRTKDLKYVVKFSWTSDKWQPEVEFLRLAHDKGVEGVPKLLGYYHITSIEEIRDGLTFGPPHRFRNILPPASATVSHTQLHLAIKATRSLNIIESSCQKRKSIYNGVDSSKRSRSNSQKSKLRQEYKATKALKNAQKSEQKVEDEAKIFKKPTSYSQSSKSRQEPKTSQTTTSTRTKKRKSEDNEERLSKRSRFNSQASNIQGNKVP